ncbi:bile salt-activated lipase-like isoform X2 [Amphiprion ocellaris]|uniref:bile salt-activated lipase-like isoform X2 n=1 Tax=Amphiprion ocellaris TaxID=80972 RepID=UPI00241181F1|nr:bile salt-activated lipase-like isoform X2 [Amphiprion ocellaris]
MMVILGILVAVAVFLETVSATSLGVVYTEGGMVEGENIYIGSGHYMDVFKGVPFADIPGRFEKPRGHPGWDGILKATEYGQECLQVNSFVNGTTGSEDCLYLNIWVPHGSTVSSDLPVMVWIYGGGFMSGNSMGYYSDTNLYSGQQIAERGNVIVVTLAYRVGALGFLSTGDSGLLGNYGLWDQQAAIAWVHRNIRSFGGDPDNITIFGESAGGASVSFQTLTPHNKGLIKRAITQSGVALCSWAVNRNPRWAAEEIALRVNCPTDHNMAACLKMTDPEQLTMAGFFDQTSSPDDPMIRKMYLIPVIDGDFLPDEPSSLFHNAADIDYMAGANDMDGFTFTTYDVPSINSDQVDTPIGDVKRLLVSYTKDKGAAGSEKAFSTYTSTWETNPSQKTIKKTVAEIGTDYMFLVPTQAALYLHAAKTMFYPSWMGADHFDDVQYVFGRPFTKMTEYLPQHRDVSGHMIAYWTNFAKTGDPNEGGLEVPVTWPKFTSTGQQYLEIHHDMDQSYVKEKMRLRYVHFWTSVLPNLPSVFS